MNAAIETVATNLINLSNAQLLNRTDIFADLAQTKIQIGQNAGGVTQGESAVAIGAYAGAGQKFHAVSIGYQAGSQNQQERAVVVGVIAGQVSQGINAVAVGFLAGNQSQGNDATAVGDSAGQNQQGAYATAIGINAGYTEQGINGVAVGIGSGETRQGIDGLAVGNCAGQIEQGTNTVAVGHFAGRDHQSNNSVAIGAFAGQVSQGLACVAVGNLAGVNSQANNSIIINATGIVADNATTPGACIIKPIRYYDVNVPSFTNLPVLVYDSTAGELIQSHALGVHESGVAYIKPPESAWTGMYVERHSAANAGDMTMIYFKRGVGNTSTFPGYISASPTSVSYATASDYRLKDVVGSITNASSRVLALNPIRFSWISTGEEVDGFLAHEAQEVVPEAVCGEKDAVNEDGTPNYQAIDQSKLVPLLVAALQDALRRIAMLESK